MIKTPISLQDLRRKIYIKAKAEPMHRFWGLYAHVCKMEVLAESFRIAKSKKGASGIDGLSFDDIVNRIGEKQFLLNIHQSLIDGSYRPEKNRIKEIPKNDGKVRLLGIPTIRDRVVQGALKLILEPVFESDFQNGSFGYRPKRTSHQAVDKVARFILQGKTRVIDLDLQDYFGTVKHDILLNKIAMRINDDKILGLLRMIMKASGKQGVPQGGVMSPLLSNIYLNEVDKMLEKAKSTTMNGKYTKVEYARFADDIAVFIDGHPRCEWIWNGINKRLREELSKVKVQVNETKTRQKDMAKGDTLTFLGFEFICNKTTNNKKGVRVQPKKEASILLMRKLRDVFKRFSSQPLARVGTIINPILRGWVNYFRIGNSSRAFSMMKAWLDRKMRKHLMRAKGRKGYGWDRWSTKDVFTTHGIFNDSTVKYFSESLVIR